MAMESPEEGLSVHPMRLKVLYTFDKEHKHNCLARCPNILQVRTAFIDDANQIGIVDLKTCVQTIVAASPELVSKLEDDFTIYAYDYSEPDTPLVGQGMLSWALSSTQTNELDDGTNMVTGRVTKNILGLFAKSAQETLEVKLRLVPVPGSTQADYLQSLQKYKQMSGMIGQGFDAQSWTNFVQSNPGLLSRTAPPTPIDSAASPVDRSGLETMQRMLAEGASPRESCEMPTDLSAVYPRTQISRPNSRTGTPMNPPTRRAGSQISRPSSRTSIRETSVQPPLINGPHQRRDSFNSGYYSGDEGFEEGPAKKRAKVVQADWSSKPNTNIERQPDSLRVAASTAASVRLHRPVPINPALQFHQQQGSTEEPVRPPTPISRNSRALAPKARIASGLRTGSFAQSSSPPPLPANQSFQDIASPEETRIPSVASTPGNMPSSPPVMQTRTSLPSSPVLPPMPKDHDSGFMSGENFDLDNYFTDHPMLNFDDDLTAADITTPDLQFDQIRQDGYGTNATMATTYVRSGKGQSPPLSIQPNGQLPNPAPIQKKSRAKAPTSRPASRMAMSSPKLAAAPYPRARQIEQEQSQQGLQMLRQIPASDPAGPSLQRSQTWAGDMMSDIPMSDMPEPITSTNNRRSRPKRFGKEQTANRLKAAISGGEMPPFCDNCGAIETPAWRKAWARIFESGWNDFETGLEKDSFLAKEIVEQDTEGNVTRFKAFKIMKSPADDDQDFLSVNLCNPCGLWLHKQKCMRPESRWNKNPKDPKEKKKRPSRPRSQRKAAQKKLGDDPTKSDAPASSPEGSDGMPASEQDIEDENEAEDGRQESVDDDGEPELPPMPSSYRANSAEPSSRPQLKRAYNVDTIVRRVQSSPIRHEVEEQDLTPKPLSRILFSPEQNRSKALTEVSANAVRRSPRLNKNVDIFSNAKTPSNTKENGDGSDGLDHLFNDDDDELPHPQTPTPTRRTDRVLFKTPNAKTPSTGHEKVLSPAAQKLLRAIKTPKALPSHQPMTTALLGDQSNSIEMTPFSRQIHQILSVTVNLPSPPSGSTTHRVRNPVTDSRGSHKSVQSNSNVFDFPDLPPLNNTTSPSSTAGAMAPLVDFSEFTNHHGTHNGIIGIDDLMMMDDAELQELLSTDVVMPSSPPRTSFAAQNDDSQNMFTWFDQQSNVANSLWDEMGGNGSGNAEQDQGQDRKRVSPRKNKGKKF